jgi:hypothetical protein
MWDLGRWKADVDLGRAAGKPMWTWAGPLES